VVSCLTAIGTEFHKSDAEMALTLTATLAFRPAGAFFCGLLADRYGRRLPLMIVMIFYSLMEMLSGLAPHYTTFLVLRALFGIGMGGEWGVGASLAMENAPVRLRGAPAATVHLRPERDATKLQAVVRSRATSRLLGPYFRERRLTGGTALALPDRAVLDDGESARK